MLYYHLSFRTTNCYGLSKKLQTHCNQHCAFPYNELLWFIMLYLCWYLVPNQVSVQRIVMVYPANLDSSNLRPKVSVQRIVMVYLSSATFNSDATWCFRTTNCYGLSRPISLGCSFYWVSVQRIVMVYPLLGMLKAD